MIKTDKGENVKASTATMEWDEKRHKGK